MAHVQAKSAPYGSWKSPVTSDLVASEIIGLPSWGIALDRNDIYWVEIRPGEDGRYVIVRRTDDGRTNDITPPGFSARTTVHEYGGRSYLVDSGTIYFSNFADQRIYRHESGAAPKPITTPAVSVRYADPILDRRRKRIICVREDHRIRGLQPVNTLVALHLHEETDGEVLVSGNDFYASPRLSPDGSRLAWVTWNHPNMPWDGNELWISSVREDGSLFGSMVVAGGKSESICQPEWSPDGVLYFVSDRTGWWNIYRLLDNRVEALSETEAEFGEPHWQFGQSMYEFDSTDKIICTYIQRGISYLATLDTTSKKLEKIDTPYSEIWSVWNSGPESVLLVAGSPLKPLAIVNCNLKKREFDVLRQSTQPVIDRDYLSVPQAIEFPTEGGLTAHGFFYPSRNKDFAGPPNERPPLIVISHGGPTGMTTTVLLTNASIQYFTSRGFAVLDVNYGGSTGYGRAYRERLNGKWGIVDVDDCVNGARYLAEGGQVDGERLIIRGGSAGGYTTLCALTFRNVFKAGASYYGVSDLEAMHKDTHKFESHYDHSLIGPYPERRDLYFERSSINFVDKLSTPIIFFQGLEDKIVPPNQSKMMFEAVRKKGIPCAYLTFEGEQHGFRKAKTIKSALEAELYFYSRIFHFDLVESLEQIPIENM